MTQNASNLMSALASQEPGRLGALLHPLVVWRGVDACSDEPVHIHPGGEDHDHGPPCVQTAIKSYR
jgi:hypothetical protein